MVRGRSSHEGRCGELAPARVAGRDVAGVPDYEKGVGDHPENKDVMLRPMNLQTEAVEILTKLFGGQV